MAWQDSGAIQSKSSWSTGVSLWRATNKDFLIARLIQRIEDLQIYKEANTPKKASSAGSSIVQLTHEPTTCWSLPGSAKVLRHQYNNQLRMLTHRWKRLGLQYPSSRNRDVHTFQHVKSQEVKNDCPLKISAIQTSHTVAQRDRKENKKRMKGSLYSSSNISDIGFSEVKVIETDSPHNTAVSLDSNSDDSDLSDQEKESVQVSKWAAPMEQDLRPEPFDKDMDTLFSTETEAGQLYTEVLPAPLKDLDCTQRPSSTEYKEIQQRLLTSDPCLAPLVTRLLELERLQAATVQKERGKQVRSRPATAIAPAQNQNLTRLRNCDFSGSKLGISGHAECSSVTCSFTKLVLCPNSLCRNKHHTCPLTKSGHVSRDGCLPHFLPKCPQMTPGKFNKTESVVPNFSLSVSPKPTTSSRTKRPRTTKKSTKPQRVDSSSAKKTMATPSRKT